MKLKTNLIIILLLILVSSALAQETPNVVKSKPEISDSLDENIAIKIPDTLCFKYKFFKGDTLTYRLTSNDSLIHNMDKPILKRRIEHIQVVCDSVDINNNYYLTYSVSDIEQKEWTATTDTVARLTSPWIGKRVKLVIDSLGNRLQSQNIDSNYIASSSGGQFQPYLFFPLQISCSELGKSWLIKSTDTLCENSFPPAIIEQTSLMRAVNKIVTGNDTLAFLTFVKTGKGFYGVESDEISLTIQDIMNTYGELQIDLRDYVPAVYFVTQEERIHILMDDGSKIPAWHYATVTFELIKLKRNEGQIREEIMKLRNDLKKKKK